MKRRKEFSWRYAIATSGGLVRDARRNEVLGDLLGTGPRAVYAGLLMYEEDFLIDILRTHTVPTIVGALAATLDASGLGEIAAELNELISYLRKRST
jgi:hypothetical protein